MVSVNKDKLEVTSMDYLYWYPTVAAYYGDYARMMNSMKPIPGFTPPILPDVDQLTEGMKADIMQCIVDAYEENRFSFREGMTIDNENVIMDGIKDWVEGLRK